MSRQIDYYFSLQSPWAYIGHALFTQVASDYGCRINYRPVTLVDLFSETGGLPLAKRHPVRQRYRILELQRWRDKRGLDLRLHPAHWPFNAALADKLVIAMVEAGHDSEPYLRLAFPAIWQQERDLGDPAVLTELVNAARLPGPALLERARSAEVGARYEKNREEAVAADVFGSPVYVLDGEVFWGQDRIELLADALRSGRKPYRGDA